MPSYLPRAISHLLIKCSLIILLIITIFFLSSATSSEACSNQSCAGDGCVGTTGSSCAWKSKADGTQVCYTLSCSIGEGSDDGGNN